jgi:hypothetical protein
MNAGNERRREAVDDPVLWRFHRAHGWIAAIPAKQEMRSRLGRYLIDAKLLVRDHGVDRRV